MASLRASLMALVVAVVLAAPTAQAATMDFRDANWSAAGGQSSYTLYVPEIGVDVTVSALHGLLWWDAADGFGVTGGENDEVDGNERLLVSFSQPVELNSLMFTDLYYEGNPAYRESGAYSIDSGGIGGSWNWFFADIGQTPATNGWLSLALGGVQANYLVFRASNTHRHGQEHEFSLAGIGAEPQVAATPEPGTLLLLGGALGMGAVIRRRLR